MGELKGIENLPIYGAYCIGGTVIGVSNLIIFMAIIKYEALRTNKVYALIMALSLADAINMSAYVFAGIRRSWLVFLGEHDDLYMAWQCARVPHSIIWSFSVGLACSMLMVVSVDRLLCVLFPLQYIGWTHKYILGITGIVYLYNVVVGAFGIMWTYRVKEQHAVPNIGAQCITAQALGSVHPWYTAHYREIPTVLASLSVFIYVVVWIIHKYRNAAVCSDQSQQRDLKHERRFTKSLAISCLCTFCLFIVPYQLAVLAYRMGYKQLSLIMWTASYLNPFANVVIFLKRHQELRQAIVDMFRCKTMPTNIAVWKANNVVIPSQQRVMANNVDVNVEDL